MSKGRRAGVQSVERAITILKSFSLEKPERGVSELSRELELHKSTVSRLMSTLESGGLLYRNSQTGRYSLGVELVGLAAQVVAYMDVREVAHPFLRDLAEYCQETVDLSVLDKGEVINLEQFVPAARQVKNIGRVGRRMAAYCTAAGKALLAHLPQEQVEEVLPTELKRFTSHTITDREKLYRELAQIRENGYAIAHEEMENGLNAVAAPVFDYSGQVQAAVSVAGPAYRLQAEILPQMASWIIKTTTKISEQLGYETGKGH